MKEKGSKSKFSFISEDFFTFYILPSCSQLIFPFSPLDLFFCYWEMLLLYQTCGFVCMFHGSGERGLKRSYVTLRLATQPTACLTVCGKTTCGSCSSSVRLSISGIVQLETTGTTKFLPQWSPAPPVRSTSTTLHPPPSPSPRTTTRVVRVAGRLP